MYHDGERSPGSTIAASEMEDVPYGASSPANAESRAFKKEPRDTDSRQQTPITNKRSYGTEDEDPDTVTKPSTKASAGKCGPKSKAKGAAAAAGSGNTTLYGGGNKIRHLKKDDGEPLWRKDIQYDFLRHIFEDDRKCFTNSYEPGNLPKQTFADLYIDAMARSSKTSKILRDKLLSEHEPAKNMAMVCLLVNLGRMNTTLNFFPEMRAQLRTYHAIPSLQAHQDPNSYKQLQDAPRLKSILKGASEDRLEPNTLEKIKGMDVPRTNPVNLVFTLAQYAPKVTELHFPKPHDFYDLIMRTNMTSKSRATAFLWLMWHYLESDFTEEGADENPFGPGVDYQQDVSNQGVPRFEYMKEDEEELENVDTPEEIDYGHTKMKERKRIIEADLAVAPQEYGPPKRGPKPKLNLPPEDAGNPASLLSVRKHHSKYESDADSTRSTPPPRAPNMRLQSVLNGSKVRNAASLKFQILDPSSPMSTANQNTLNDSTGGRRSRPLTAHQLAVEHNRNQRVNYILSRGLQKKYHQAKKARKRDGTIHRSLLRMRENDDEFEDSEGEENLAKHPGSYRERGFRGIVQLNTEDDDFGEEISSYAAAFRRMGRRLDRWEDHQGTELGVVGTSKSAPAQEVDVDETEDENDGKRVGEDGDVAMDEVDEDLDDMEKEILGLDGASEGEDEDLDDVDKALLGLGDETEDERSEGGMDVD